MSNRSCVVRSDLATDPFQVTNIYDSQSAAMKAELAKLADQCRREAVALTQ